MKLLLQLIHDTFQKVSRREKNSDVVKKREAIYSIYKAVSKEERGRTDWVRKRNDILKTQRWLRAKLNQQNETHLQHIVLIY